MTNERIADIERIATRNPTYAPGWKETNFALQQIMSITPGTCAPRPTWRPALHLRRLRARPRRAWPRANVHELGRSLEVLNLMDFGELIFLSALDRKETRDTHVRTDYVITNPLLNNKAHIVKLKDGEVCLEWRTIGKKRS